MVASGSARWTRVVNVPPPRPTISTRARPAVDGAQAEQRVAHVFDRDRARIPGLDRALLGARGDPKRITRRGPSSITSTRPKRVDRSGRRRCCEPVRAHSRQPPPPSGHRPASDARGPCKTILPNTKLLPRDATAPRVSIGCLALLLGVLFSTTADAARKRVGVPKFDGVQEALVRKKVMQILKAHGYDLAKSREMEIGLANTGALLDNDEGFAKVAKELALSAIVTGEIGKKRAKIAVHDGKDGSLLGEASFAGANPRKIMAEVGRDFWKKLGGEIERGKTPSGAKKPQKVGGRVARGRRDHARRRRRGGGERAPAPEPTGAQVEGGRAGRGGRGRRREAKSRAQEKEEERRRPSWKRDVGRGGGGAGHPADASTCPSARASSTAASPTTRTSAIPGLRPYSLLAGAGGRLQPRLVPDRPVHRRRAARTSASSATSSRRSSISSTLPDRARSSARRSTSSRAALRYRMPFGGGHYFYGS